MPKTDVMKKRMLDINPQILVDARQVFFLPDTAGEFDFSEYDYVVDAVDNVTAKIAIIEAAKAADVPVISCMEAGNKLDPTKFMVAEISKTDFGMPACQSNATGNEKEKYYGCKMCLFDRRSKKQRGNNRQYCICSFRCGTDTCG